MVVINLSPEVGMKSPTITVYSFELVSDSGRQHMPFKATREAIESRHGGKPISGTAEEVPASELDVEGRFLRRARGWTLQDLQQIC